ncbi:MAG: hypothetical protein KJN97_12080 [Deltaproteobacteria bacterium]|nr:hypothetical protein [Deltaproteobacteria bacterium]
MWSGRDRHEAHSTDMERNPSSIYLDPLDAIWLTVADRIGFRVERSAEVYASTDGAGLMTIGDPSTLDADDCLAQMILHELCHSLVGGEDSLGVPDFGLDNESERDIAQEHACLRLQAWLTKQHGLRQALAPTTDFRSYYDELPEDPLADDRDPATIRAKQGAARSQKPPWAPHIEEGLVATQKVMKAARDLDARDPASVKPPIWSKLRR